jgi:alpha-mannosidase
MSLTFSPAQGDSQPSQAPKKTLVLVSHTHWDREWYLTFQQYRFKLVRLVDRLLAILDNDAEYAFFMLDGQTIVLEDYLEVRPDRRADLERHITSGRLLVGPWYILADQFLVSGEAHIQNLLRGLRTAQSFGRAMRVGYVPDPFGHTGQMPQILKGFDIDSAVFWRGVGPDMVQVEFVWIAPDGTAVNGVHLPGNANIGGYSSAVAWNSGPEAALTQLKAVKELIIDRTGSNIALLMNGNDHVEPAPDLPATLRAVRQEFEKQGESYQLIHGTLPLYLELARKSGVWEKPETPRHVGEFRDSQLAYLLPGVTSSRMPIKQRNATLEGLLEREAGPALAWAASLPGQPATKDFDPASLQGLYHTAWKYLLQNQPHDSICGCSIDPVHQEMQTRYEWIEQIGFDLRQEGNRNLTRAINTTLPGREKAQPIVIFNPVPSRRTDLASLTITAPEGLSDFVVTDDQSNILPHTISSFEEEMLFTMDIPAFALNGMAAQAGDEGRIMDYTMASLDFLPTSDPAIIEARVVVMYMSAAPTDPTLMQRAMNEVQKYIENGTETFRLTVYRQTGASLVFIARDMPPTGYKTFFLQPNPAIPVQPEPDLEEISDKAFSIENEFYELTAEPTTGLFNLLDKETGEMFTGLNRFRDGADAGDEYNYSPAVQDRAIESFSGLPEVNRHISPLQSKLIVKATLELPVALTDDRQTRAAETVNCPVDIEASLVPGLKRVDFTVTFENLAKDHRLQVVLPATFAVTESSAEQAFDVVRRPTQLPAFDNNWREDPVPTAPQKSFVSIYDAEKNLGFTVMNRGLPEYEILPADDTNGSAIALTLLRCVGWLSRSDLLTRRDHAGPGLATPDAQLLGQHKFYYAVQPHRGDWLEAEAQQQAHAFNHPLTGLNAAVQPGLGLPGTASLVEIEPGSLALSTIKPAEDGSGLVLRVWNPATTEIPAARFRFYRQPARVWQTNLAEDALGELTLGADGWYTLPIAAKRIITLKADFHGHAGESA